MKNPSAMSDVQLWKRILYACNTCKTIVHQHNSYDSATYENQFIWVKDEFELCAEEFDDRGLKTSYYSSKFHYSHIYLSEFFMDRMEIPLGM